MTRLASAALLAAALALGGCTVQGTGGGDANRMSSSFRATNNFLVVPGPGSGEFTVLAQAGASGKDFFCAAGDYAHRRLGAPDSMRVMLVTPAGPNPAFNGQRTAGFRVVSSGEAPPRQGINISARRVGENLLVGHARANDCGPKRVGFLR